MCPNFSAKDAVVLGTASIIVVIYVSTRYGLLLTKEFGIVVLSTFFFLILVMQRRWLALKLLPVRTMIAHDGVDQSKILPDNLSLRRSGVAVLKKGNLVKVVSGVKVSGNPGAYLPAEPYYQRARPFGYEYLPIFWKYRDLFVSLQRLAVPIRYVVLLSPLDRTSPRPRDEIESISKELRRLEEGKRKGQSGSWNEREQLDKKLSMARRFGFVKISQFLLVELAGSISQLQRLEEESILLAEKVLMAVLTTFPQLVVEKASPAETLKALYSLFWDECSEGELLLPHEATPVMNLSLPPVGGALDLYSLFPIEPPSDVASHDLHIGWVEHLRQPLVPFTLSFEDLNKHLVILGSTGSGKSTTAKRIIEECVRTGLPVLVFDWHNEYPEFAQAYGDEVYRPGAEDCSFTVSPLNPFSTRDLAEHVALTTDIFAENYSLTHPQAFMLREAIREVLSDPSGDYTLCELVEAIESAPTRSYYHNETKMALLRRLKPLTEGQAGRALGGKASISIPDLLGKTVVVELGHFRESQTRRIFSSFVLKMIYDYRVATGESKLRHVCVIEEASNIVPRRDPRDPQSIGERMVSELRKFGEGMVVICQFPSQVSHGILKNSSTRICHRIGGIEEERAVRDLIGLTEIQFSQIKYLRPGQAVVFSSASANPYLVSVDPPSLRTSGVASS